MKTPARFALAMLGIALSYTPASAEDSSQSCMQDALTLCGQFIPNRERVAACLMAHRNRVSPGCRKALTHFH